jgi:hypothetical protein
VRPEQRATTVSPGATLKPIRNLKLYLAAIFSLLATSVLLTAVTTYFSLRSHLQQQQQREIQRSQDFNELQNVLIQPFQLSQWMSRDTFLLSWLQNGERDSAQVQRYLKDIAANGQVSAFVASNLTRTYYFSDGTSKALTRDTPDVDWFFQLLEHKVASLADVGFDNGDTNKPFLYTDIRMPDIGGQPSAYVGTAVALQRFLDLLTSYKQTHGDDLHFVNQDGMVILSSTPGIVNTAAEHYRWYRATEALPHAHGTKQEKSLAFENRQGRQFSVHREWIQELGWHVYTERDLQTSQTMVRTLKGILPICCSCKKIRDDKGYWQQLEDYLHQHSEADLSHGICPECVTKLYPELKLNKPAKP